jgi:hypothetical protein
MVLDPISTFLFYTGGILLLFTLVAVVADLWTAKAERDARHQARAAARAERMNGERSSLDAWQ